MEELGAHTGMIVTLTEEDAISTSQGTVEVVPARSLFFGGAGPGATR